MNWSERIKAARISGEFTYIDRALAERWPTCACGEQDPRIPLKHDFNNQPKDQELTDYGFDFYKAVAHNRPDDATDLLDKIEIRAAQILFDLGHGATSDIIKLSDILQNEIRWTETNRPSRRTK